MYTIQVDEHIIYFHKIYSWIKWFYYLKDNDDTLSNFDFGEFDLEKDTDVPEMTESLSKNANHEEIFKVDQRNQTNNPNKSQDSSFPQI